MFKNKFLTFISFLLVTFGASAIGSLATINYKEPWYSLLNKPTFNPPDWVFGPVWTTLYLMMTHFSGLCNFLCGTGLLNKRDGLGWNGTRPPVIHSGVNAQRFLFF